MMPDVPFVVFCDIDLTLIGRSDDVVARYRLCEAIKELVDTCVLPASASTNELTHVGPELMRPGFGAAIKTLRKDLNDSLALFVCTLSPKGVTHGCKVPGIEAATGVRFHRPYFCSSMDTTDNCPSRLQPDKKTVLACFYRSLKALCRSRRWKHLESHLSDRSWVLHMFRNRFLMIDDTANIATDTDQCKRIIRCPRFTQRTQTFDMRHVASGISRTALKHPDVRQFCIRLQADLDAVSAKSRDDTSGADDDFWPKLAAAFVHELRQNSGTISNASAMRIQQRVNTT